MRISVEEAIRTINAGEVVAVPTDTVYGLAAKMDQAQKIYTLKGRPPDKPLLILAASVEQILPFLKDVPNDFLEKIEQWPGPTTLVLPVHTDLIPNTIRRGNKTAGFRIPNCPPTLEILRATGPLGVPSANPSDHPPATTAAQVENYFSIPVVEGDQYPTGRPSTILIATPTGWLSVR